MARPPLGNSAKSEIVSIRVTPAEKAKLEAKYRSAARGLRAILTASFAKDREEERE